MGERDAGPDGFDKHDRLMLEIAMLDHTDPVGPTSKPTVDPPDYDEMYRREHSLGWTDASNPGEWAVRVTLAVLFVILPLAAILAAVLWALLT